MPFIKNDKAKEKFLSPYQQILSPFYFRRAAVEFSVLGSLNIQRLSKQCFCFYLMTNFRMVEPRSVRTLMK